VQNVPTILRLESVSHRPLVAAVNKGKETARLKADGIFDEQTWNDFVKTE
jgi:hypothetical protein